MQARNVVILGLGRTGASVAMAIKASSLSLNVIGHDHSRAVLREDAIVSSKINFKQLDRAPEDVLNRILWRAMRGSGAPYPEWAISAYEEDEDDE